MAISRRRLLWLAATGGTGVAVAGLWRGSSDGTAPGEGVAAPAASPTPSTVVPPTADASPRTGPSAAPPSEAPPSPAATPTPDAVGESEPAGATTSATDEPGAATGGPKPEPTSEPAPTPEVTSEPTPEPREDASAEPSTQPSPQPSATGARDVICRDALAIPPGTQDGRPHTPARLMLHHTAVSSTTASQAPGRLRAHSRYHQQQGWPTIAYHYAVDLNGNLYELRDVNIAGDTFTSYDPAGWFLVVCEGDFNSTQPTDRLLDGVATMFAHGAAVFGIDPATLAGHRDHASTSCPGDLLYAHRDALVAEVQRRLGAGGTTLPRTCGEEADRRIAAIEAGED